MDANNFLKAGGGGRRTKADQVHPVIPGLDQQIKERIDRAADHNPLIQRFDRIIDYKLCIRIV